jgi:hypothetical protein
MKEGIADIPAKRLEVAPALSTKEAEALLGTFLDDSSYDRIISSNVDVFCKKTGDCLLKFRRNVIPQATVKAAYEGLRGAALETSNRGTAAGKVTQEMLDELAKKRGARMGFKLAKPKEGEVSSTRYYRVLQDGTLSKTTYAYPVISGVAGFMGPNPRFPYCRQTAFTQQNWSEFVKAYPIIKLVDEFYEALMPRPYRLQKAQAEKSSPDFVIKGTSFTTVTVNRNWQTACHTDKGDFREGFGNLTVLRRGAYTGGYFVLPQYRIAVDMQNCDLLLVDVHRVHGNTPIKLVDRKAERVSLVMYYREDIATCGTVQDEIQKARSTHERRAAE